MKEEAEKLEEEEGMEEEETKEEEDDIPNAEADEEVEDNKGSPKLKRGHQATTCASGAPDSSSLPTNSSRRRLPAGDIYYDTRGNDETILMWKHVLSNKKYNVFTKF